MIYKYPSTSIRLKDKTMGKQLRTFVRTNTKPNPLYRLAKIKCIRKEIDVQWNPSSTLTVPKVSEDGQALITIITKNIESKVLCTGFNSRGNKYTKLLKVLRSNGHIPKGVRVRSIMKDKKFVNIRVNARTESFIPGDKIIIDIK